MVSIVSPELLRFSVVFLSYLMKHDPSGFEEFVKTRSVSDLLPSYDFIVVGAGSAGSVIANRLSENPKWNILLLEAGGQENHFSRTPVEWTSLQGSGFDWNYTSTQQTRSCLGTDGICPYPRGLAMGGSSAINAMTYVRGYKTDYDEWGVDNVGWSYKDVHPFFLKLEGSRIQGLQGYGTDGPLTVSLPTYHPTIGKALLNGGKELGWENKDCPNYEDSCIEMNPSTIQGGRRFSTSSAYLETISHERENLHVVSGTLVEKIIIENNCAKGVQFTDNRQSYTIKTSKEVIVSAGSINSPKLLMLSGIGLKDHLKSANISVIADLPVGNNLQDHVSVSIRFQVSNGSSTTVKQLYKGQNEYLRNQTGPLSSSGTAFLAWSRVGTNGRPVVQHHISALHKDANDIDVVAITSQVVRPRSRGTVRLNTLAPSAQPLIDVNYFSNRLDYEYTRRGVKETVKLMKTNALRKFYIKILPFPQCNFTSPVDQFIDCSIRYKSDTVFHPVGTVKMSPKKKGGVVDNNLLVYGVEKLRVCDASIAPSIVSMNTNAMAVMIGEKCAHIIKTTYR